MPSPVLGIDLGTTNSVVAFADQQRVRVLRDDEGHMLTPSTVSFHPSGQILVGHAARERRLVDAAHTVFSIKRLIGRPFRSSEVRQAAERLPFTLAEGSTGGVIVRAREETYSLPEISSFVLRKLRSIAEQALGQSCVNAVITVPANFNELQRMATRDAGRIAGLNVLRILNEPTAAALAYGYTAKSKQRIAVYDLGGGTFDISILELSGDVIEVIATAGDTYLGGDDIDRLIADRMVSEFLAQHYIDLKQDIQAYERVCMAAEWVKCQLSLLENAEATVKEVAYVDGGNPLDLTFRLARSELDQMIVRLIGRTFDICEDAMRSAGVRPTQLDGVILVGGQTRTPKVRGMVGEYFGMEPQASVDPDLVVGQGAALQGYALSGPTAKTSDGGRASRTKTLSGPPPAARADNTLEYAKPTSLAMLNDSIGDAFDDEPTRVASHSEAATMSSASVPVRKRSEIPFDDLPTTVAARTDSERPVPARVAPAPPRATGSVQQTLRPSTQTLPETPAAKAGVRPSQLPSARKSAMAPVSTTSVPKAPRIPSEAIAGFPLAVENDEVTEDDLPSSLKAELKPSPSLVAPPLRVSTPAPPTAKTLADSPKAKAVERASLAPPPPPAAAAKPVAPPPTAAAAVPAVPTVPARAAAKPQAAKPAATTPVQPTAAIAPPAAPATPPAKPSVPSAQSTLPSIGPSLFSPTPASPPPPALVNLPEPRTAPRTAPLVSRPPVAQPTAAVQRTQSQFPTPAREASTLLLLDVTPHTLAVETAGGFCEEVIERNAPIPTEQTRIFSTSQDNQAVVSMRVCQGEARRTEENQVLGKLELLGLRQGRRGEVSIAVTFMIDADGTLNVKATDRTTGKAQGIRVSLVGALGEQEIERMRARQAGGAHGEAAR